MSENFFANYKEFVVTPFIRQRVGDHEFNPNDYANFYILTFSLYDSLLSSWEDASVYNIDVKKSIDIVLNEFNEKQDDNYHLQLLEYENDKSYFVFALSCKNKIENQDVTDIVSHYIETLVSNSFYIGQNWYRLIGQKGRIERKLFTISIKEYTL